MLRFVLVCVILCLTCWDISSAQVCSKRVSSTEKTSYTGYRSCGWWGWSRCSTTKYQTKTTYSATYNCCNGSYGIVSTNCSGECNYTAEAKSSLCKQWHGTCRDFTCDKSGFSSPPQSVTINENDNDRKLLWTVNGTCFVRSRNPSRVRRAIEGNKFNDVSAERHARKKRADDEYISENVPATECTVDSTDNIAEASGLNIYRKACSNPTCKKCSASDVGCLNHNQNYTIRVSCFVPGYVDIGTIEHEFTIDVEEAEEVQFNFTENMFDEPIPINNDVDIGDVILSLSDVIVLPDSEPDAQIFIDSPVSEVTGEPMFEWNDQTLEVVVASDLSEESSGTHVVSVCVELRRGPSCIEFTVTFVRTTTTSTTTTTVPEGGYFCNVSDNYARLFPVFRVLYSEWCYNACKYDGPQCVYIPVFCKCSNDTYIPKTCRSVGTASNGNFDFWCNLNCNFGDESQCPSIGTAETYCECE